MAGNCRAVRFIWVDINIKYKYLERSANRLPENMDLVPNIKFLIGPCKIITLPEKLVFKLIAWFVCSHKTDP